VSQVHEKQKSFECPVCKKVFGSTSYLRLHREAVHDGVRYPCLTCGKEFTQKGNMQKHVRTVHEKRQDFACPLCGKKFGEAGHMKRHREAVHDGVRHKCPVLYCGKTYAQRKECVSHLRQHTEQERKGLKPIRRSLQQQEEDAREFAARRAALAAVAAASDPAAADSESKADATAGPTMAHSTHQCNFAPCERVFHQEAALQQHVRRSHNNIEGNDPVSGIPISTSFLSEALLPPLPQEPPTAAVSCCSSSSSSSSVAHAPQE
jgi:uncharacterized Zn-finger protein